MSTYVLVCLPFAQKGNTVLSKYSIYSKCPNLIKFNEEISYKKCEPTLLVCKLKTTFSSKPTDTSLPALREHESNLLK